MKKPPNEICYMLYGGGFYKIGKSKNPLRRFWQLKTQMPFRVIVAHVIKTSDSTSLERYWHLQFKDKRANGEWFKLNQEDVERFRNHSEPLSPQQKRTVILAMAVDMKKYAGGESKWLKYADLEEEGKESAIVTIKDFEEKYFEQQDQTKLSLEFREFPKPMILNVTNVRALIAIHGDDPEDWIGKKVKLILHMVNNPQTRTPVQSLLIVEPPKVKRPEPKEEEAEERPARRAAAKEERSPFADE